MSKRHAGQPAVDPMEDHVALNGNTPDVVQEGGFQDQFGDQTTPDALVSAGESSDASEDALQGAIGMDVDSWRWLAMWGLIDPGDPPPGGELAKFALLTPTSPDEATRAGPLM